MKDMKTNIPYVPRLTDKEEKVIQSAFNLTDSIVSGLCNLPKPMIKALCELQHAVHELAHCRGMSIEEGCSKDYLGYAKGYWDGVEDKLKKTQGE